MQDAHSLAPRLRREDVEEAWSACRLTPLDALLGALLAGEAYTGMLDDLAIAMFGVVPHPELRETGLVWMLGSPEIAEPATKFRFRHAVPYWVDQLNEKYPLLTNIVDARNEVHLKWLQRLGFIFINKHAQIGPDRLPFYEFIRIKGTNHVFIRSNSSGNVRTADRDGVPRQLATGIVG